MAPRVLYVQYTNPANYPPLQHGSRVLADAGWDIYALGIEMSGTEAIRFPPHPSVSVRLLPACSPGVTQKAHYVLYCLWAIWWALRLRRTAPCLWVYASDLLACPVALLLAAVPGIVVAYHEHDLPGEDAPGQFTRACLAARRHLACRARLIIVPNEARLAQFQEGTRRSGLDGTRLCVWNCPTRSDASLPRESPNDGDVWLHYHGTLVPARLPAAVLHALCLLPEHIKLRVIGYETAGHSGYRQELQTLARHLDLEARVEFHGAMSRTPLLEWGRRSHIGLALLPLFSRDPNERTMVGASNKPFDYLACGLALVVSDLDEWRRAYVLPGFAAACDPGDAASIAAAVRTLAADPGRLRAMGESGRLRILADWNYERQFAPVVAAMTDGARGHSRPAGGGVR